MPSIAQQDYIVIKSKRAHFYNDAEAMSKIAGAISRGTILDCIIGTLAEEPNEHYTKPLAYKPQDRQIYYIEGTSIRANFVPYSQLQYQGLAAIQNAEESKYGEQDLPLLSVRDGHHLVDDNNDIFVCVDGKYINAGYEESVITGIEIASSGPAEGDDFANITWEDAQKLIGITLV